MPKEETKEIVESIITEGEQVKNLKDEKERIEEKPEEKKGKAYEKLVKNISTSIKGDKKPKDTVESEKVEEISVSKEQKPGEEEEPKTEEELGKSS